MSAALSKIAGCALAAALVLLVLAPHGEAGPSEVNIKVAKSKDGKYREQVGEQLGSDKPDFFFRVTNRSNEKHSLTLHGSGQTFSHRARWFRGDNNITEEVTAGSYGFDLRPGRRATFRMVVTLETDEPDCFFGQVNDQEHSTSDTAYAILKTETGTASC
jgi:hypothetical protein